MVSGRSLPTSHRIGWGYSQLMFKTVSHPTNRLSAQALLSSALSLLLIMPALALETSPFSDEHPLPTPGNAGTTTDKHEVVTPVTLQVFLNKGETFPIDLDSVLRLIVDQNLTVKSNEANSRISTSQLRQSQTAWLPSINGSLNQSQLNGGIQVFGGDTVSVVRKTVQPQIGASMTVFPGGKSIFDILAAKRRKNAADIQIKESLQTQLSLAAQEYYKLLAAQVQRDVVLKGIEETNRQLELNEARLAAGLGNKLDVTQAKTLLAQKQRDLITAENTIAITEQGLINRLNLDPHMNLASDNSEQTKRQLVSPEINIDELVNTSLKQNPALQRVEQTLQSLGMDYKSIRSDFIPSVTLRTYLNGTGPSYDTLLRSDFKGFTLNVNLLENMGLNIPFRLQEKKGQIEKALIDQKILVNDIQTRVRQAFLNSRAFDGTIEAAEMERQQAEESYEVATQRYKAGFGTNLDIITAEVALTSARANIVQAVLNYNQAQVQLLEAIGKITPENIVHGVPDDGIKSQ